MRPTTTTKGEHIGTASGDGEATVEPAHRSRSLLAAATTGYAVSLALFIVPLIHFMAIPAAPAVGSIIASNMLDDPHRRRLSLALMLTLLWEVPVAGFAVMKATGVGFMIGWPGLAIAGIAAVVAIWAFGLALLGSLVADRVQRYAKKRWRGRGKTEVEPDGGLEGGAGR